MRMRMRSRLLKTAPRKEHFVAGGSGFDLRNPKWQPNRQRASGVCPQVRLALLGLS